jgi:hypothetical protein
MGKRKAMEKAQQAAEAEPEQQAPQQEEESEDYSQGPEDSISEDGSEGSSSEEDDSAPEVSDEQEDEDSPDEDPFDQIDVNFQFFDPKESDFHGLKALLHTYLDGQQYDSSPLVDTIIAQVWCRKPKHRRLNALWSFRCAYSSGQIVWGSKATLPAGRTSCCCSVQQSWAVQRRHSCSLISRCFSRSKFGSSSSSSSLLVQQALVYACSSVFALVHQPAHACTG